MNLLDWNKIDSIEELNTLFNEFVELKYNNKGFGLFTGLPGTGKSFTLRSFASSFNQFTPYRVDFF